MANKTPKQKFADGYNLCVHNWNNDISDKGKTPVRGYAAQGYEECRRRILMLQMEQKAYHAPFKMEPITAKDVLA